MEIQNEIIKTEKKISLLMHQNEKFKALLDKALSVTQNTLEVPTFETQFLRESLEVIEEETEILKRDLSTLGASEEPNVQILVEKVINLEKLYHTHQEEIQRLKGENAEIKFLLSHPKCKNQDWLYNVLKLEAEVFTSNEASLVEERFRLQRKILTLENKKADLLIAINDVNIPEKLGSYIRNDLEKVVFKTIDNHDLIPEYEDLRFKMLNLEDERSRLLNDLQCILDESRRAIAEEYSHLQEKIVAVEQQKDCLKFTSLDPADQKVTDGELESIFNSFRNLPLSELETAAREERAGTELGTMFCPGLGLPMYCCIL